ncbi:hypothetical protein [Clostridium sp. CF012]|nr:hypothetical protein [Clostridium sp. CF012]MBU3145797.1 hypothetical protein [Clostridium sp. CF012]
MLTIYAALYENENISGSNLAIISEEQFNKVQLEKKYWRTAKIKNS